jgi:diketogulonate reductase-like aldo/keto reductase
MAADSRGWSAANNPVIARKIPVSGEHLPVIGMGSWQTFDVGNNPNALAVRVNVLQEFFNRGGALVDSSPMYGSSENVIGYCLKRTRNKKKLFSATKVWTWGKKSGENQMELSRRLWGVARIDAMQIHNMLDWEAHLETLKQWKLEGRIRYIGITTSHGRRHKDLEKALSMERFDFVQFTYNVLNREVEQHLLPLAAERGIAVIINRPFKGGDLFSVVKGKQLPLWTKEFDCANWAQFFLKYIVSHPTVTCAIPATSRVDHMIENMGAGYGRLPDKNMRERMTKLIGSI